MSEELKSGGCLCGDVRYEARGEPAHTMLCHCKVCQKTSGSALSTVALFPKTHVKLLSGTLSSYPYQSDSDNTLEINFCPRCGSPVMLTMSHMPDLISIKAGSFDDTSWYKPTVNIWTDSRQPWVKLDPEANNLPKQ
jgi:hypothetical protein